MTKRLFVESEAFQELVHESLHELLQHNNGTLGMGHILSIVANDVADAAKTTLKKEFHRQLSTEKVTLNKDMCLEIQKT